MLGCALLPKPDGGVRPLTIASVYWRIGASALARKLDAWAAEWASLVGGLLQRSGEYLHGQLHHDVRVNGHDDFASLSEDL